jgi:hypothetical protein
MCAAINNIELIYNGKKISQEENDQIIHEIEEKLSHDYTTNNMVE